MTKGNEIIGKFALTEEEVLQHPIFGDFYSFIGTKMGVEETEFTRYDCRNICVTPALQESWYEYYTAQGVPRVEITMALAMSGPKATLSDEGYVVEVDSGYICSAAE